MSTTVTSTHSSVPPVMHCWGLVKNLDNNEKLELVEMLLDSLKPVVAKAQINAEEPELRPYSMAEINAMIDAAEADIAAGRTIPHEEVMRRWDKKIANRKQEKHQMAEAV